MARENNITQAAAESLVGWLTNEGVLDYDLLKETYLTDEEGLRD